MRSVLSAERLPGKVLRIPLRLIPDGSVVPILATAARGKRWIAGSGPHSCWLGWNELRKRRLFSQQVKRGSVVYDVGANVGTYTILASVLVGPEGRVVAFEPVADNLRFLRSHIMINRLDNVTVVEAAVTDRSGATGFEFHPDRLQGRVARVSVHTVRSVSLDDLIARGAVPAPEFLKIDVEGGEHLVLRGADETLLRAKPVIFLATHGEDDRRACSAHLTEKGYRIEAIGRDQDEWIARPIGRPAS